MLELVKLLYYADRRILLETGSTIQVKPPPKEDQEVRTPDTVGQQIKEKRVALKWSRARLAREAGV